jgi:hypothetical protein
MYNTVQTDSEFEETSNSPSDQSKKNWGQSGGKLPESIKCI